MIGNLVGRTLKVDSVTYLTKRGRYARICVELDLHKKLCPAIRIFRKERTVEYEGLHLICFCCGKYGHRREVCPDQSLRGEARGKACDEEGKGSHLKVHAKKQDVNVGDKGTSKRARDDTIGKVSGEPPKEKETLGIWNIVKKIPKNQGSQKAKFKGRENSGMIGERKSNDLKRDPMSHNYVVLNGERSNVSFMPGYQQNKNNMLPDYRKSGGDIIKSKKWVPVGSKGKEVVLDSVLRRKIHVGMNNRRVKQGPSNGKNDNGFIQGNSNPFEVLVDHDEMGDKDELAHLSKSMELATNDHSRQNGVLPLENHVNDSLNMMEDGCESQNNLPIVSQ